jgi:6-pyruvoyl-tetrahydropterin synthase
MSTVSVKTHFAAGHRILGLTGEGSKCRNIHGHTFHVTWTFEQNSELEFGTLKAALRSLVKWHFDHGFVLDKTDDFAVYLSANMLSYYKLDGPPTTEALAAEIAKLTIERLTLPYNEYSHGVIKEPKEDDKALYPSASLLEVSLDEGPENNATWKAPVYVSNNNTLSISPNTTWGTITTYGPGGSGGYTA